jgi:hypothetical protein
VGDNPTPTDSALLFKDVHLTEQLRGQAMARPAAAPSAIRVNNRAHTTEAQRTQLAASCASRHRQPDQRAPVGVAPRFVEDPVQTALAVLREHKQLP